MNKKILHYANLLFCIIILLPDLKKSAYVLPPNVIQSPFPGLVYCNSVLRDPFYSTKPQEGKAARKSMEEKGDFVKHTLPQ